MFHESGERFVAILAFDFFNRGRQKIDDATAHPCRVVNDQKFQFRRLAHSIECSIDAADFADFALVGL
jgi:hypothetical protein